MNRGEDRVSAHNGVADDGGGHGADPGSGGDGGHRAEGGHDVGTRFKHIYDHPVGRDAIDKILLQLGRSRRWVTNPVVANMRLGTLAWLAKGVLGDGFAPAFLSLLADHPDRAAPIGPAGRRRFGRGELRRTREEEVTSAVGTEAGPAVGTEGESAIGTRAGPDVETEAGQSAPWWHSAVFYQVYPRSFADSDGDGVGDLQGVISRLEHLVDLGVDCLWLSPVFDSPNEDMGYDIRDYRAVMAEMGTLDDLDELIAACHQRGMRIILDLVVNHTSAEHPWFGNAVEDPDGPYGAYYHLRPGVEGEDGSGPPPNNWTSFFGGSAWRWIPQARRWALHLFAPGQMDLNWDNPAVRAEVADVVRWWRARGIDGFRLDVINYISKRRPLPDGDEAIGRLMGFTGIEHYFFGPRLHEHLRELRAEGFTRSPQDPPPASVVTARGADGAPGEQLPPDRVGVMVGETPGVGVELGRLLSGADRRELDLVFNFDFLDAPGRVRWEDYRYDLRHLKAHYQDYYARIGPQDRIALFLENHDNPRMISKVLGAQDVDPHLRSRVAKALATIQLALPGTPFLFQGQEIGAINQAFTAGADLRDVESLNRLTELRAAGLDEESALARVLPGARDHARVPMRWEPATTGFTSGTPWQPGREDSAGFTVAEQEDDPGSVLSFYRDLIRLRRAHPGLTDGGIRFLHPRSRHYFGWVRSCDDGDDAWLVEINLADRVMRRPRRTPDGHVVLGSTDRRGPTMAPFECLVARVHRR